MPAHPKRCWEVGTYSFGDVSSSMSRVQGAGFLNPVEGPVYVQERRKIDGIDLTACLK